MNDARAPAQFFLHIGREEIFERLAAFIAHQIGHQNLAAVERDMERRCGIFIARLESGQPLVAHQHEKLDLREVLWRGGIEIMFAVLDGKGPVGRKGAALLKRRTRQRLGREPLDGVAVETDDP